MKKMMLVLSAVSAFVAGARAAVNFTGPGSDVASAANWGGSFPGSADSVNFPAAAIPAGGLTLSAGVNFGATTFAAGYSGTVLFDLSEHAYTANNASMTFNSSVTFKNGYVTNSAISVAANQTLTVDGAVMRLTGDSTPLASAGATLVVTNGAAFYPGGKTFAIEGNDKTIQVSDGGVFDASLMTGEYNIATQVKNASDFNWSFDGASGVIYALNWGGKANGAAGLVQNSKFSIRNKSDVYIGSTSGTAPGVGTNGDGNSRGVFFGAIKAGDYGKYSISNLFEVVDSSFEFATTQGQLNFAGTYDHLFVSNSTFTVGGGCNIQVYWRHNRLDFINSAYKLKSGNPSKIDFGESSSSNVLFAANCTDFQNFSDSGTDNVSVFSNMTKTGTLTINGLRNRCAVTGGKVGAVTLGGQSAFFAATNATVGNVTVGGFDAVFAATNSTIGVMTLSEGGTGLATVSGGSIGGFALGNGRTLTLSDGASYSSGTTVLAFNNKTNATLVLDNATVTTGTYFGNKNEVYTGCPGTAIAFRGATPKLAVTGCGGLYYAFSSGTVSGENEDGITFDYLVPQDGYTEAPLYITGGNRGAKVYGNTHFRIAMEGGKLPEKTMTIPLVYDDYLFSQNSNRGIPGANVNPDELTTFNKDRIPEGAMFVLSADKSTLSIVVPHRKYGLVVVVR